MSSGFGRWPGRGRTVVSRFRNVNTVDHFYWFEDGERSYGRHSDSFTGALVPVPAR
ncbi:DUF6461 domain-containing protein [Streptomyces prunicolor]|uniref:DUF6461 domain-containing protein n=1 Tax=Streptomyces prunicolor TaxID=67348 RepID=UPI0037215C53